MGKPRRTGILTVGISPFIETRNDWVVDVLNGYDDLNEEAAQFYRTPDLRDDPLISFSVRNIPQSSGLDPRRALAVADLCKSLFPGVNDIGLGVSAAVSLIQDAIFTIHKKRSAGRLMAAFGIPRPTDDPRLIHAGESDENTEVVELVSKAVIALLNHDGLSRNVGAVSRLVTRTWSVLDVVCNDADWSGHTHRLSLQEMGDQFLKIETVEQAAHFMGIYGPLHLWEPYRGFVEPMRLSSVLAHVRRHGNFLEHGTVTYDEAEIRSTDLGFGLSSPAKIGGDKVMSAGKLSLSSDRSLKAAGEFALASLNAYHLAPLNLELPYENRLAATAICKTVEEGMRAYAFLNRLAGRKWRRCAFERCGKLFKQIDPRSRTCGSKCTSSITSKRSNDRKKLLRTVAESKK